MLIMKRKTIPRLLSRLSRGHPPNTAAAAALCNQPVYLKRRAHTLEKRHYPLGSCRANTRPTFWEATQTVTANEKAKEGGSSMGEAG